MGRVPCCEKVGLKRGRWTAEEDEKLVKYIKDNGEGSWRSLPKNAGLLRCGKSCRLRWINYLREDLKRGNISREEEEIIIKLHASLGQRWSLIASHLPGRTDNEIKNYWNSHLSRRIHTFRRSNGGHSPIVFDIGDTTRGPRRKGGRTSRSALKKSKKTKATTATAATTHNNNIGVPINEEKGENSNEKEAETAIIKDCWDGLVGLTDNGPTMMSPGDGPSSSSSSLLLSSMMGQEKVGSTAMETTMEEMMMMWSWFPSWEEEMEVVAPPEFMIDGGGSGGGGDFWEECEIARWAMELW